MSNDNRRNPNAFAHIDPQNALVLHGLCNFRHHSFTSSHREMPHTSASLDSD
jgi:hypothetical protein